jgi:pimeloyl-ACP methyl ester carboxylesterase
MGEVDEGEVDQSQVDQLIEAFATPRRLREARVAAGLAHAGRSTVACRWGDVAAWRLGDGPAVLLVHGYEDDSSLWDPLIDELAARRFPLVAFDLPGHGASGGSWGASFEGTDAIVAVADQLGPIRAAVGHSAGCGMVVGALNEGWPMPRAVFIAPPLGAGDRWARYGERLGFGSAVVEAARTRYYDVIGAHRAGWSPRAAYPQVQAEVLVVHSVDDEHFPSSGSEEVVPLMPNARLELVHGLTHRRTARDPGVVSMVADFVTP